MVKQHTHIIGHGRAVIRGGVVKFTRRAMPAIVERNGASPGAAEGADPPGLHPVDLLCGRKPVDEHDRPAFPFVEICDLDVTVPETWHELYLAAGRQGGNLLHRSTHAPFPPPTKKSQRRTFGGAFERRYKAQYGK